MLDATAAWTRNKGSILRATSDARKAARSRATPDT